VLFLGRLGVHRMPPRTGTRIAGDPGSKNRTPTMSR